MIDKTKGADYEGFMPRWNWGIIVGALLWAALVAGCQPSEPKVRLANTERTGETLDIKSLLSPGRTTAVNFFSPYCRPCLRLAPILEKLAARMPEVAFIKLNINRRQVRGIDWRSPLARQFQLKSIPYFLIFDSRGKLVAEGPEAQKMVKEWLEKAGLLRRARK